MTTESQAFLESMRRREREAGLNPRLPVYWLLERLREQKARRAAKRAG